MIIHRNTQSNTHVQTVCISLVYKTAGTSFLLAWLQTNYLQGVKQPLNGEHGNPSVEQLVFGLITLYQGKSPGL